MGDQIYTVITFAPVQGFIEKSRKLRDLYGSSYLLSLLSWVICQAAQSKKCEVVSPASIDITQGMPNQIIIKGNITEAEVAEIRKRFDEVWKAVADSCREWIEKNVTPQGKYTWKREWDLWGNHAWEFFAAIGKPGESITKVRERMNQVKTSRNWTGINWQGESSTISGADAIAYPNMGATGNPRTVNYQEEQRKIRKFYEQLSLKLEGVQSPKGATVSAENEGYSFINVREELSIPELIKRLITHEVILEEVKGKLKELEGICVSELEEQINTIAEELNPRSFKDLNRHKDKKGENKYWTGWFQGDGDGAGKYFKSLAEDEEEEKTTAFSEEMRAWGQDVKKNKNPAIYLGNKGRMIYAGGDDFLGVLYYSDKQIAPKIGLDLMSTFKSKIWHEDEKRPKKITASVGFVWAGAQVPQRDVLQHCREAEQSAKKNGRDRIAFRILFNSGNHLEWVCPWWVLDEEEIKKLSEKFPTPEQNLIKSYKSRSKDDNWTHFYQDVALLESRHAFKVEKMEVDEVDEVEVEVDEVEEKNVDEQGVENPKIPAEISIAVRLIEIYFSQEWEKIIADTKNWWNVYDDNKLQTFTGILGDPKSFDPTCDNQLTPKIIESLSKRDDVQEAFNNWVINLAKVGFYLTEEEKK